MDLCNLQTREESCDVNPMVIVYKHSLQECRVEMRCLCQFDVCAIVKPW